MYVCLIGDKTDLQPRLWRVLHESSLTASKELKEKEEYIDNVHIEAYGSEHMLLWIQRVPPVPNQQLHVKRQKLKRKKIRSSSKNINMSITLVLLCALFITNTNQGEHQSTKPGISSVQPRYLKKREIFALVRA